MVVFVVITEKVEEAMQKQHTHLLLGIGLSPAGLKPGYLRRNNDLAEKGNSFHGLFAIDETEHIGRIVLAAILPVEGLHPSRTYEDYGHSPIGLIENLQKLRAKKLNGACEDLEPSLTVQ